MGLSPPPQCPHTQRAAREGPGGLRWEGCGRDGGLGLTCAPRLRSRRTAPGQSPWRATPGSPPACSKLLSELPSEPWRAAGAGIGAAHPFYACMWFPAFGREVEAAPGAGGELLLEARRPDGSWWPRAPEQQRPRARPWQHRGRQRGRCPARLEPAAPSGKRPCWGRGTGGSRTRHRRL